MNSEFFWNWRRRRVGEKIGTRITQIKQIFTDLFQIQLQLQFQIQVQEDGEFMRIMSFRWVNRRAQRLLSLSVSMHNGTQITQIEQIYFNFNFRFKFNKKNNVSSN